MRKMILSLILSFTLISQLAWGQAAPNLGFDPVAPAPNASPSFVLVDPRNEAAVASTQIEDATPQDVSRILDQLPQDRKPSLIISTDSAEVIQESLEWSKKHPKAEAPRFMLFGSILKDNPVTKVARSLGAFSRSMVEAARRDTIGLMVTVVTTGIDSYIWIHSQSVSIEQKTAMILMNLMLAATFGLDKDLWSRMTRPVEARLVFVLEKFRLINAKESLMSAQRIATRLIVNTGFSIALQLARMSVYSIDSIAHAATTAHFWLTPITLGALLTFSNFGWGEQMVDINEEKAPTAKFFSRRWMEIRNVAMAAMAPSSKLLQPDVYGITPLIILAGHGVAGFLAMLGGKRIVRWVERSETLRSVHEGLKNTLAPGLRRALWGVFGENTGFSLRCEAILRPGI